MEVGPPVPGTYRHDFMNDTEPRRAGEHGALRGVVWPHREGGRRGDGSGDAVDARRVARHELLAGAS